MIARPDPSTLPRDKRSVRYVHLVVSKTNRAKQLVRFVLPARRTTPMVDLCAKIARLVRTLLEAMSPHVWRVNLDGHRAMPVGGSVLNAPQGSSRVVSVVLNAPLVLQAS